MKSIVYILSGVAGATLIWLAIQVLPVWRSKERNKEAATKALAARQADLLDASAKQSVPPALPAQKAPVMPVIAKATPPPIINLAPPDESELRYIAEQKKKEEEKERTDAAIRGYHEIAARMAKEREASEEKERRQHELEVRRLELETARANAKATESAPPLVVVVPSQGARGGTSLREIQAIEQQNEELRLFRLQVALEMARLRGERVTIVDYGIGAEKRRQAAAVARAMNDPDPLRRAKSLRALGYQE